MSIKEIDAGISYAPKEGVRYLYFTYLLDDGKRLEARVMIEEPLTASKLSGILSMIANAVKRSDPNYDAEQQRFLAEVEAKLRE